MLNERPAMAELTVIVPVATVQVGCVISAVGAVGNGVTVTTVAADVALTPAASVTSTV